MATTGGKAIIGSDLAILGEVRNAGEIEVLGLVKGSISAERIIVHPGGRIIGNLNATSAEVNGRVDGRVRVRNLISIGSHGAVHGDVHYGQLALAPGGDLAAEVRNVPPELGGDFELAVRRGRSVAITSEDLNAVDPDDAPDHLTYQVTNPSFGFVAHSADLGKAVATFTQAEINQRAVLFVHDGSAGREAGFDVVVADQAGATSGSPKHVKVLII